MKFFEDIEVGVPRELGSHTVTEEQITRFASEYDPLPFHTDPDAAAETIHGELIASGYHTLCLANRIVVEEFRAKIAAVVGFGIDELVVVSEITAKRPSESRPGLGIIENEVTVTRDGELVLSYRTDGMVEREGGGRLD